MNPIKIAMTDDDPSEHVLMLMAAEEAELSADFSFYEDGAELLLHLGRTEEHDLPDLIVLDLRMPGLDGHRTLDELQADPVLWRIPVVVFTSSPRTHDQDESFSRGAVSFMMKPSDFDGMIDVARTLLDRSQSNALPAVSPEHRDTGALEREQRRALVVDVGDEVEAYLRRLLADD